MLENTIHLDIHINIDKKNGISECKHYSKIHSEMTLTLLFKFSKQNLDIITSNFNKELLKNDAPINNHALQ
jgi:hypothetical protein